MNSFAYLRLLHTPISSIKFTVYFALNFLVLYILFDLDNSGNISLNELLIIFKSVVMGYCKLTDAELPSYTNLEKFAKLMFLKSDI